MLLFQWGTHDWGNGASFELNITRQFMVGDGEDDDIKQLLLTFAYPPSPTLASIGDGNHWCHSPSGLPEFRSFVSACPAFAAVSELSSAKVSLDFKGV